MIFLMLDFLCVAFKLGLSRNCSLLNLPRNAILFGTHLKIISFFRYACVKYPIEFHNRFPTKNDKVYSLFLKLMRFEGGIFSC